MMRCCKHCGALLEDDVQVCDFCGAVLEVPKAEPVALPVVVEEAPAQEVTKEVSEAPSRKKLTKKAALFLVGGIVLAVLAVIVAVNLLIFNPHIAVDKYEAVLNGDFDKIETLAPKEYWDYMAERTNMTTNQYIEDLAKLREETYLAQMSQDSVIGKLLGKELRVLDTEKVNANELAGIGNALEEEYGISADRVHAAYRLILKYTAKGSKESSSTSSMVTAIRIDSDWYLIRSVRRDESTWRVTFLANAYEVELLYNY
jgi:hypothetical protein